MLRRAPCRSYVPGPANLVSATAVAAAAGMGPVDFPQLLLAAEVARAPQQQLVVGDSPFEQTGADTFFYVYLFFAFLVIAWSLYQITKPALENRWLVEKIYNQKLKFITDETNTASIDKYDLGRLYIALKDMPSALAELEEAEEEFDNNRIRIEPDDTMGALAQRAMLHNSKGYALLQCDPPRTAQARREFVRAVTFWPEYPEALVNIGNELLKRKRYEVANRTLNSALKWQPGDENIQQMAKIARMEIERLEEDSDSDDD